MKKSGDYLWLFLFLFILLGSFQSFATTIVPPKNLGELAKGSPIVVLAKAEKIYDYAIGDQIRYRTDFITSEVIKGNLPSSFTIQKLGAQRGALRNIIHGEPDFTKGVTYLLFLEEHHGFYRPIMMSYGIYFKEEVGSKSLLVPLMKGMNEFNFYNPEEREIEPFYVYTYEGLRDRLSDVVNGRKLWDNSDIKTNDDPRRFAINTRQIPSHCVYLPGSAPFPRWQNFETSTLPVYYHEDGDTMCASPTTVFSRITNAISDLNFEYSGINLSDGGVHGFVPDCAEGSAASGNFTSSRPGRSATILFGDPCDEISNANGDFTTLAVGGTYWYTSSTHTWGGEEWYDAVWGYVIVNDVTTYCNNSPNYTTMMIHELTHTLGFGHIDESSGVANMNGKCCNDITALDRACLDYTYLEATLPVDLVAFDGILQGSRVVLEWKTESEIDNDYFVVERSVEEGSFEKIGQLNARGGKDFSGNYRLDDVAPGIGKNTYRLIQVDTDGRRNQVGNLVTILYTFGEWAKVFPNPIRDGQFFIEFYTATPKNVDIQVFDSNGKIIAFYNTLVQRGGHRIPLNIEGLSSGIYYLWTSDNLKIDNRKIIKL